MTKEKKGPETINLEALNPEERGRSFIYFKENIEVKETYTKEELISDLKYMMKVMLPGGENAITKDWAWLSLPKRGRPEIYLK